MQSRIILRLAAALLLLGGLLPSALHAEALSDGDAFASMTLEDQHGKTRTIGPETRLVLFAPDRDSGAVIHAALHRDQGAQPGAAAFERGELQVLADISGMPSMIASLFALPKMRGYSYPLLVSSEAQQTAHLPREEGKVTLIRLENGRVSAISYTDEPAEIEQLF